MAEVPVDTPGRPCPNCGTIIVLDTDRIVNAVFAGLAKLSDRISDLERRLP